MRISVGLLLPTLSFAACPSVIQEAMNGATDIKPGAIVSGPGTCTQSENRYEVMWFFTKDATEYMAWLAWSCYCTESNGTMHPSSFVKLGFGGHYTAVDSPQFKPCTSDADCSGCAPKCVTHEQGGSDCRPIEVSSDGSYGCSLEMSDPTAAFNPNLIEECFPDSGVAQRMSHECKAAEGEQFFGCEESGEIPTDAREIPACDPSENEGEEGDEEATCGMVKREYKASKCCGNPDKDFLVNGNPVGLSCSTVKDMYKTNNCCGQPEKIFETGRRLFP